VTGSESSLYLSQQCLRLLRIVRQLSSALRALWGHCLKIRPIRALQVSRRLVAHAGLLIFLLGEENVREPVRLIGALGRTGLARRWRGIGERTGRHHD